MAAGIHSSIGIVTAGSAFALLQSAGTAPALVSAIGATTGAVGSAVILVGAKGVKHLSSSAQQLGPAIRAIPIEKLRTSVEGGLKNLPIEKVKMSVEDGLKNLSKLQFPKEKL
jgi:hypothetical protein